MHLVVLARDPRAAVDLSRAEGKTKKTEEALSAMIVRAKEAEKRLRKESSERERMSADLAKVEPRPRGSATYNSVCFRAQTGLLCPMARRKWADGGRKE